MGDPGPQNRVLRGKEKWASFRLDDDGCLSLEQILTVNTAPITEQHAWAIAYMSTKSLLRVSETSQIKFMVLSFSQIFISREGEIHHKTFTQPGPDREAMRRECKAVGELGFLIYNALDYNVPQDEERNLSPGLDNLLESMTAAEEQAADPEGDAEDEGICETGDTLPTDILQNILGLCRNHLAVGHEADQHYKAVLRALVAEVLDLTSFMKRVTDDSGGNKELQDELRELAQQDWANMWTSVMHQLRTGVRLKKVNYSKTPTEFELTPYEMMMDDIRTKKFKLNHVEIPAKTKSDARDLILEFIRSRPPLRRVERRRQSGGGGGSSSGSVPRMDSRYEILHAIRSRPYLKPASKRQLKALRKESTPGELLMEDIRSSKARQSLRRTNSQRPICSPFMENSRTQLLPGQQPQQPPLSARKLIQPDEQFSNEIFNFDGDDQSPNTSQEDVLDSSCHSNSPSPVAAPSSPVSSSVVSRGNLADYRRRPQQRPPAASVAASAPSSSALSWRKSVSIVETPRAPPTAQFWQQRGSAGSCSSSEESSVFSTAKKKPPPPRLLAATADATTPIRVPLMASSNINNNNNNNNQKSGQSYSRLLEMRAERQRKYKYQDWIKSHCRLDLNLQEVAHIRSQLSKAELEDRNLSRDTLIEFEKGRVCFHCGNVKFGIFTWSHNCIICSRHVCSKCITKLKLPSEKLSEVLVSHLAAQLTGRQEPEEPAAMSPRPFTSALLERSSWNRHSLKVSQMQPSRSQNNLNEVGLGRPKLVRSKTMGKAEVDKVKAMKLSSSSMGTPRDVCLDCRDMLTNMIREKIEAERLERLHPPGLSNLYE